MQPVTGCCSNWGVETEGCWVVQISNNDLTAQLSRSAYISQPQMCCNSCYWLFTCTLSLCIFITYIHGKLCPQTWSFQMVLQRKIKNIAYTTKLNEVCQTNRNARYTFVTEDNWWWMDNQVWLSNYRLLQLWIITCNTCLCMMWVSRHSLAGIFILFICIMLANGHSNARVTGTPSGFWGCK